MVDVDDLLPLNDAEKDFKRLYELYPAIHQNPPKTLDQLRVNEREVPEYREVLERYFGAHLPRYVLSENLFQPREDVALLMHTRYVPGFIHYHEFFEITYVLNGHYRSFINGSLLELDKGGVCVLSPNVWHCPITHFDDDVVCNILVRSSTFEHLFFHILRVNPILARFFERALTMPNGKSYLTFSTDDDAEVRGLILTMLDEYRRQDIYYPSILEKIMAALFVLLLRNHTATMETAMNDQLNFSPKITDVLKFIRDNIKDISYGALAKKFSYSERQLSRLLLKYTGRNFTSLLQEMRIQRACMLLKHSNLPISEVIDQCGYKNHNHFYVNFKKYCGKTPAQYRRSFVI